jgi:Tfp pilus assembly protein PilO
MFIAAIRRLAGEIVPLLVVTCVALGSLALVRIAAVPQWRTLRMLSPQAARYSALARDTAGLRIVTEELLDKKEKLARQYALVVPSPEAGGPQNADLPGVLGILIQRAKEADIRFVKMQPVDDARDARHQGGTGYPVVLEMTTSYGSLGRFVSSLEELPRQFTVERLAVTVRKNGLDVRILVTCILAKAG